jgi:hypothetical protein
MYRLRHNSKTVPFAPFCRLVGLWCEVYRGFSDSFSKSLVNKSEKKGQSRHYCVSKARYRSGL